MESSFSVPLVTQPNPYVALLVYLAMAAWVIRFARSCYSRPYTMLGRWYSYLPQKAWARRLLRGFSVVWIFCGFLIIGQGLLGLPFIKAHRSVPLGLVLLAIAALSTMLVLWRARRQGGSFERE